MVSAPVGETAALRGGPVLVYSKYDWDLDRFRRVLGAALPGVTFNYAGSPAEAEPHLADAEILYGWGFSAELLRRMPKLRWVQKMGAGVDDIIGTWPFGSDVILTRTDGRLIATRMIEYVLAAILDKSLKLHVARQQQAERRWAYIDMGTIRQLTVGVAGLGEIGGDIARALEALGARVIGWRRSAVKTEGVSELFTGDGGLEPFVQQCDVVVLVLPLTRDTRGIFGEKILRNVKPGAHLINVGRGGVLDETALLGTIDAGLIAHATLDVFATEPLPDSHPFWRHPAITITPHVCGPLVPEDVAPHFIANFAAFAGGHPLRNTIDVTRQY
ncbi:MAG TPA: NAD(P)-dependent oxidoreductase [Vineibacter sp.]|nr:NAD(P)-dependent oxidoreductase [Vineibacter sp.]